MEPRDLRISARTRNELDFKLPLFPSSTGFSAMPGQAKDFAHLYNSHQQQTGTDSRISAAKLHAIGVLHALVQSAVSHHLKEQDHDFFARFSPQILKNPACHDVLVFYAKEFPSPALKSENPNAPYYLEETIRGYFIHQVLVDNTAVVRAAKPLVKPTGVAFPPAAQALTTLLGGNSDPAVLFEETDGELFSFLTQPARIHPESLEDQLRYILDHWGDMVPEELRNITLLALDHIREEDKPRFAHGPGPSLVPDYSTPDPLVHSEHEAYSADRSWMPNVVMIAKSTLVWLDQLSKMYGYPITTLDAIPDRELDILAQRGFTSLWLIGLWERSTASKTIKTLCGNPEAEASAYSLKGYDIAGAIGGWPALKHLDFRCRQRNIRLASDMVPNHTGIDSDWICEHPEYFIRSAYPPFPSYTYTGPNLSPHPDLDIRLEDHYFNRTDAAVTFARHDRRNHSTTYVFHGNDGTSMPWNDTAQLDFLNPDTREAVIQQILHVARNFHVIRFDAAMTLARKHVQRLWYPSPGSGGDVPGRVDASMSDEEFNKHMPLEFWREVVDRVTAEVPDTLLLAEAFWMMEGYFVRTLGMHRVYNSAFMNMLKNQENKKYRDTIKNTIAFDPEVLKRFVNFMNNPDEETAITQFGNGDKYFGICTLLATMPGLPMFGHGQIEGFHEKYGMEYRKAYWNEFPDDHLVQAHAKKIFPLLRLRHLFSGSDLFELFDAVDGDSAAESIFAYVNGDNERRVMVLYNNQQERAQGRLTVSAPKLQRFDDGRREHRTTTVAESLGLGLGGRRYLVYDNFTDGLTYLVPAMSVYDEGLWVHLQGYETRVFLNIRELEDFDGSLERLCQKLGGKGTPAFSDELQAIRLQPVHKALDNFRSTQMLALLEDILAGKASLSSQRSFVLMAGEAYARLSTMYESLEGPARETLPPLLHSVDAQRMVRWVMDLSNCFSRNDGHQGAILPCAQTDVAMEELVLVVQTCILARPFLSGSESMDECQRIIASLHPHVFFQQAITDRGFDGSPIRAILEMSALIASPPKAFLDPQEDDDKAAAEICKQLLSSAGIRSYLKINEHQGITYYHKESLQEIIILSALGACLALGNAHSSAVATRAYACLRRERNAHYRADLLVDEGIGFRQYD